MLYRPYTFYASCLNGAAVIKYMSVSRAYSSARVKGVAVQFVRSAHLHLQVCLGGGWFLSHKCTFRHDVIQLRGCTCLEHLPCVSIMLQTEAVCVHACVYVSTSFARLWYARQLPRSGP